MKDIIKFIFLIFVILKLINADLPVDQFNATQNILTSIGLSSDTPCSYVEIFTCAPINDGISEQNVETVTKIEIDLKTDPSYIILPDFSSFKNVTSIYLNGVLLPLNFFSKNQFPYLNSLNIGNLTSPILDTDLITPSLEYVTIGYVSTSIGSSLFNSEIKNLEILSAGPGYSIPSYFENNTFLSELLVPISTYSNLVAIEASKAFTNLTRLGFNVYNEKGVNFSFFYLPTFAAFTKLNSILFNFISDGVLDVQLWPIPASISLISTLDDVEIRGKGFDSSPVDFSNFKSIRSKNPLIQFSNGACQSFSNISYPSNTSLIIKDCDFLVELIDFENIQEFTCTGNQIQQTLPLITPVLKKVFVKNNTFIGNIPDSYCTLEDYSLTDNLLNGTIPSCFICIGAANLLPNNWKANYVNSSSVPYCPTFKFVVNYPLIVKTDGSSSLVVDAFDFGRNVTASISEDPELQPYIQVTIPNRQLIIHFPIGDSYVYHMEIKFGNPILENYIFNYTYEPPVVRSYGFENEQLVIYGTGFSYIRMNNVTIDDVSYITPVAVNGGIKLSGNPTSSLSTANSFLVFITVGQNISRTVEFYLFKTISINMEKLNSRGGTITLDGIFGTVYPQFIVIKMNGTVCIVRSVSETKITFNYPKNPPADNYELTLSIGGHIISRRAEYVFEEPTTSTGNNGPSSDEVSNSSKLLISLSLLLLLSFIILLLN